MAVEAGEGCHGGMVKTHSGLVGVSSILVAACGLEVQG